MMWDIGVDVHMGKNRGYLGAVYNTMTDIKNFAIITRNSLRTKNEDCDKH